MDDLVVRLALATRDGQWLMAVSLAVVGAVWALRRFGGDYWPWLRTRRGGAVLALVGGQAGALVEALQAGTLQVETLVRGLVAAFLAAGGWSALRAAIGVPKSGAAPRLITALLVFGLILPSSAVAEGVPDEAPPAEPAPAPIPPPPSVRFTAGPTVPLLMFEPGVDPWQALPGAGVQVGMSFRALERTINGTVWDMLSLQVAVWGSLVSPAGGPQFGRLAIGAGACTMSSLICVIGGKQVLSTGGPTPGWFLGLSWNVTVELLEPPAAAGALPRGNTIRL